ncbi:MAG: hypothetical protein CMD35_05410 [Flavobacteriales bacterium]|nr:hypothetical protein [Flavobacteriales bacterium]
MKRIRIAVVLILSILNLACRKEGSEKVNQDEIWMDYRLIYSGEHDSTYSRVSFRHGSKQGESLKLSSRSSITINDDKPLFNGGFMWYQSVVKGFDSLSIFNYEDVDGKVFTNNIQILNSIDLPEIDTIYKDSSIYFPWVGNPIEEDEVIWLVVGELEDKIPYISIDSVGKNGLFINTDSIKGLPLGDVSIHFERWYKNQVDGNSVGAIGYGHYISKKRQVHLINN